MKQDFLFKEVDILDANNLNCLLSKGFFIVSYHSNSYTNSTDYHLRRTLLSFLFRGIGVKKNN